MNVISFYLLTGAMLIGIFVFFKPLNIEIETPGELPQIELNRFLVHEVTPKGVKTILGGAHARRFEDRYVVEDINLTDFSGMHEQNMKADNGTYKGSIITLKNNVRFKRDDGIVFECRQAVYNQDTAVANTIGEFNLRRGTDSVIGSDLIYNGKTGDVFAKRVTGRYTLKESS